MAVSSLVAAGGGKSQYTVDFTSSGTFTLPSGYGSGNPLTCDIIILGGGGGGGAGGWDNASPGYSLGGGGGGSGIGIKLTSFPVTSNTTITIGAGGAGGSAPGGSGSKGSNGANGGNTSFGTIVAPGGGYGGAGGGSNIGQGESGGDVAWGTLYMRGGYAPNSFSAPYRTGGGGAGGSGGAAGSRRGGFHGGNGTPLDYINWNYSNSYLTYSGTIGEPAGGAGQSYPAAQWVAAYSGASGAVGLDLFAYQPLTFLAGGGGGGGLGYNNYGLGGKAGTFNRGGEFGQGQVGSGGAAAKAGEDATTPSAGGGGGGGGSGPNAEAGGRGGNGASGLVRITYWA